MPKQMHGQWRLCFWHLQMLSGLHGLRLLTACVALHIDSPPSCRRTLHCTSLVRFMRGNPMFSTPPTQVCARVTVRTTAFAMTRHATAIPAGREGIARSRLVRMSATITAPARLANAFAGQVGREIHVRQGPAQMIAATKAPAQTSSAIETLASPASIVPRWPARVTAAARALATMAHAIANLAGGASTVRSARARTIAPTTAIVRMKRAAATPDSWAETARTRYARAPSCNRRRSARTTVAVVATSHAIVRRGGLASIAR